MDTPGLIKLICAVNAFGARGDSDPTPLGAAARSSAMDAVGVLTRRLVLGHLAGNGINFDLRGLRDLVRTLDRLIVKGDGYPVGLAHADLQILWGLRCAVLERMSVHPGGDVAAETIDLLPDGQAARRLFDPATADEAGNLALTEPTLPVPAPGSDRELAAAVLGPAPAPLRPPAAGPLVPPAANNDRGAGPGAADTPGIISYGEPTRPAGAPAPARQAPAASGPGAAEPPLDLAAYAVPDQPTQPAAASAAPPPPANSDRPAAEDRAAQAEAEARASLGPISRAILRMHEAIEGKAANASATKPKPEGAHNAGALPPKAVAGLHSFRPV